MKQEKKELVYIKYQKNNKKMIDVFIEGDGSYTFFTDKLEDVKKDFPTTKYKYINLKNCD